MCSIIVYFLNHCSFVARFDIRSVSHPTLVFLHRIVLAICNSFQFFLFYYSYVHTRLGSFLPNSFQLHMKFRFLFSIMQKYFAFGRHCIDYKDYFEEYCHLKNRSSNPWAHVFPFSHSCLISLSNLF
jgi:hypothetical protein